VRDSEQAGEGAAADAVEGGEAAELLREKEQLEHAMESRPVIDMACGVLMAGFGCGPKEAWEILVAVSQHANVKLREVADAVTAATTEAPMPAELQEHLAAAVQAWQEGHGHGHGHGSSR
jgi:hypothetical protein